MAHSRTGGMRTPDPFWTFHPSIWMAGVDLGGWLLRPGLGLAHPDAAQRVGRQVVDAVHGRDLQVDGRELVPADRLCHDGDPESHARQGASDPCNRRAASEGDFFGCPGSPPVTPTRGNVDPQAGNAFPMT